ncbi:hypothetical protein MMC27_004567 [Xylographa pallens]|nr:hypothetical protein [Xylographa pallens]
MVDNAHCTGVDEDEWHNVADAKKRKQIQDKLAQRASRKRLREANTDAKPTLRDPGTQKSHDTQAVDHCHYTSADPPRLVSPDALDLIPCDGVITAPVSSSQIPSSYLSNGQAPTMTYEPSYPLTVFSALYINGRILGLTTCTPFAAKSSPVSADVPLSLQPTPTQPSTVHHSGIDRSPFSKMRDNYINMTAFIDEEEISHDLFTLPSFSITPGAASWDPAAWKIEQPFTDK